MKEHNIGLTTPEISSLWRNYLTNTATRCILLHFLQHVQDLEIKLILNEQLLLFESYIQDIKNIFNNDNFPIPKGYSDEDVYLSAPALYTDLYALSFTYRYNQMVVSDYATVLTKVARQDIVEYYSTCLVTSTNLYKKALDLMLSKGIYDRPPKINYPDKIKFVEKQENILTSWFGEHQPLNSLELGEIFYTIERNYIGKLLLMGFIQIMKDVEIKKFLLKGKELAEKQIDTFNQILKEEEHLGSLPVSMEITDSRIPPFSDRLIMFMIATTAASGIFLSAYAMSFSMRKDLIAHYSLFIAEIMKYGGDGLKIMIDRGWMEQPPQAMNRNAIYKT